RSELRRRYVLIGGLVDPKRAAELSVEQRLDLSEYLIRLRRYPEAIGLLQSTAGQDRTNFLVLSNLATACQLNDQAERGISYLEQALSERVWPKKWEELSNEQQAKWASFGLDRERYDWYRKVEGYQLKLLRFRALARERSRGRPGAGEQIDELFAGEEPPKPVSFVGESGEYEPGALAAAEQAKLPPNAVQIVEQLLLWLPDDNRLYWLLGELLNARGEVPAAKAIFDDLANRGFRPDALVAHRRKLAEWTPPKQTAANTASGDPLQSPPVATLPAWQPLAVAFGAGALLGLLAAWQLRETRRRLGARLESEN